MEGLELETPAYARNTDPETSHLAAKTVDAETLTNLVLTSLRKEPATTKQLADKLGIHLVSISPRIAPLVRQCLVVDSGKRFERAIIWEAVNEKIVEEIYALYENIKQEKKKKEKEKEMPESKFTPEALQDIFSYHAPSLDQQVQYQVIRDAALEFSKILIANTPASADQTTAIRKLRECVMTANASIALEGKY